MNSNNNFIEPYIPRNPDEIHQEIFNRLGTNALLRAKTEENMVRSVGSQIGYGRLMQLAQQEWRSTTIGQGLTGSEFAYGPCVSSTVICGCQYKSPIGNCEWCCGSGWLTRRVREAQILAAHTS